MATCEPRLTRQSKRRLEEPHAEEGEACTICLDPLKKHDVTMLPCGHSFHAKCMMETILKHNVKCPMCRTPCARPLDQDDDNSSEGDMDENTILSPVDENTILSPVDENEDQIYPICQEELKLTPNGVRGGLRSVITLVDHHASCGHSFHEVCLLKYASTARMGWLEYGAYVLARAREQWLRNQPAPVPAHQLITLPDNPPGGPLIDEDDLDIWYTARPGRPGRPGRPEHD